MARRNVVVMEPQYKPSWQIEESWGDIIPGDLVKVRGEMGSFTFKHVHVKESEVIAVIVYCGTHVNTTFRAFYPEKVTKIVAKTKRKRKGSAQENEDE